MDRVLRDTGYTPTITTNDATGAAADIPGGMTNATVTDSAGVAIAGSPFAVTDAGVGLYTITIPASALHILDVYSITWNGADGSKRRSDYEVVGGFYFSVSEVQALDPVLQGKSADQIRAARSEVEERFEERARIAFVPRGRRYPSVGDGTANLVIPDLNLRSVAAASINGVALSGGDIAALKVYPYGLIQRSNGLWTSGTTGQGQNVSVLYEYGLDQPPAPIKSKALKYVRHLLVPSSYEDDRLVGYSTDVGFARVDSARGGSTGFPDIDSVLDLYGQPMVLVR